MGRNKPIKHGTPRGYRLGCRCDACREAERTYRTRLRREKEKRAAEVASIELERDKDERLEEMRPKLGGDYDYIAIDFGRDLGVRLVKIPPVG